MKPDRTDSQETIDVSSRPGAIRSALGKSKLLIRKALLSVTGRRPEESTEKTAALAARSAAEKAAQRAADEAANAARKARSAQQAAENAAREASQEAERALQAVAAAREAVEQAKAAQTALTAIAAAEEAADMAAEKAVREAAGKAAMDAATGAAAEATETDKAARIARASRAAQAARAARAAKFARKAAERAGAPPGVRPRRFNLTLAIVLSAAAALLVIGVWGAHEFQVKRTARRMLARAENAEQQGDLAEAIRFYDYYVNYTPDDADAFSKLALLLADQAEQAGSNPRAQLDAHRRLERAASRQPDNLRVCRRLADISMKLGRMSVAAEQFRRLLKEFPEEPELEVKLGRCLVATEHERDAISTFEAVKGQNPQIIDAYVELANLLHDQLDDTERAEAEMNLMVANNRSAPRAYLERARFRRKIEDTVGARQDILQALEIAPDGVDVLVAASQVAMDDENYDEAWSYLDRARELYPDDNEVHQAIAVLNVTMGKTDEAIDHLQEAVRQRTDDPLTILSLADLQLKKGDLEAVRKTVKKMDKMGYRPEIVQYFLCRIQVAEGKWRDASYALERLRANVVGWPEFRMQVELLLGACYEQLRLPDRQLEMYERVLDEDPTLVPAQVGYAAALVRRGRFEEASSQYRQLENSLGSEEFLKIPSLRNNLFQMIVAQTEQLPEVERDWAELETFLEKVEKLEDVGKTEKTLMRAELLAKTDRAGEGRQLVTRAYIEDPKDVGLRIALAKLTAMQEGPREGLQILGSPAGGQRDDSLPIRLVKAELLVRLDPAEAKPALAKLGANLDDLAEVEKVRLWRSLGAAHYRLRDRSKARAFWQKVADARPRDAKIRLTLFELAREAGDETQMVEAIKSLAKALGERSSEVYYCRASQLVWKARSDRGDLKPLGRAKQLLGDAAKQRPDWQEIPRLRGEIALLENKLDEAIDQFLRASELGPLSPVYLGQLVRLLYVGGRFDEARDVMRKLGGRGVSLTMRKLEAELSFLTGDLDQALALASQTVADSDQPTDFLWYGQILGRAKKYDQAREAFRRAVDLDPTLPQAWPALVALLVEEGKRSEAQQVVLEAQTKLPEDRTPLVLAQCYHILGDVGRAEQNYLNAISLHPEDLSVIRNVARFYMLIGRSQQARTYLDQIVKLASRDPEKHKTELVDARRLLARIMAAAGDWRQLQQALALLERNAGGKELPSEDLRLKAIMLASRPERESRQQAIALFEQLRRNRKVTLTLSERLAIAQLYEKTKQWEQCHKEMLKLLEENPEDARVLSTFVQMQIRNYNPTDDVTPWLDKLEKLQPEAPLTVISKAQLLTKAGQPEEATRLLLRLIPRPLPPNQVGLLPEVAKLLEEIEQFGEAEKLLVELAEKSPGGAIPLAAFLGRCQRVDAALDRCEAALEKLPTVAVLSTALSAMLANRTEVTPAQIARLQAWFDQALKEGPVSKSMQLQLAGFHDLQDDYPGQAKVYRALLARSDMLDRERAIVWNNLAFVLVAGGQSGEEALEMINNAIDVLGPSPELLDTRALAQLTAGESEGAIADLLRAIADSPTAMMYFHLALAYQEAGDDLGAAKALQTARENHQLTIEQIPKIERDKYLKLVNSLGNL